MHPFRVVVYSAWQDLHESVLRCAADGYVSRLQEQSYAARTVAQYVSAVAHFAHWLERDRAGDFPPVRQTDFREFLSVHLAHCSCSGRRQGALHMCRAALRHLPAVLRECGWYEEASCPSLTPVDQDVELFDNYLRDVCGAAQNTRVHRTRHVREFLTYVFEGEVVRHDTIQPDDIGRFLAIRSRSCRPSTLGVITDGLRSYLRFLQIRGQCSRRLLDAVPQVARWRLASVPRHLKEEELRRFLRAFDRRSRRGRRDYGMALCLVNLGLRVSEVATLRLTDTNWRAGTLTVSPGKTRRGRTLPLSPTIGHAMVAYLRVRPRTTSDRLFLRLGALEGAPLGSETVRSAMRLAYARAGLPACYTGTHLLRHTAATRLVASGATIKEVADVLGHRSLDTTAVYAKVDVARLRQVALPWLEVVR